MTGAAERSAPTETGRAPRPLGVLAMCGAVLCFSLSSTIARKAGLPGPILAFWRMVITTGVWWLILFLTEHRVLRWSELKRAIIPGAVFGINITCFFTAITRTSIANAEFIGALTPLIVVPAGALFFHEKVNRARCRSGWCRCSVSCSSCSTDRPVVRRRGAATCSCSRR